MSGNNAATLFPKLLVTIRRVEAEENWENKKKCTLTHAHTNINKIKKKLCKRMKSQQGKNKFLKLLGVLRKKSNLRAVEAERNSKEKHAAHTYTYV